MKSHEYLSAARATLAGLQKILKDCDPASGVSFAVRRGVARDDENQEVDSERRPWVTLELSNLETVKEAFNHLLKGAEYNVTFWADATRRDIAEAQKVLDAAK